MWQQNDLLQNCELKDITLSRSKKGKGKKQFIDYNAVVELNEIILQEDNRCRKS